MGGSKTGRTTWLLLLLLPLLAGLTACGHQPPPAPKKVAVDDNKQETGDYVIGAGDALQINVWRNPELSLNVTVRPDGKISLPLIEDLPVAGKTPTQMARDVEKQLSQYVQNPIVTILVNGFVGPLSRQIRVVGEATKPQALPYRADMTALDVMIAVGGLTDFAAGNRAIIVRMVEGKTKTYRVKLDDLVKDGDVRANVPMLPGDILMIPQTRF